MSFWSRVSGIGGAAVDHAAAWGDLAVDIARAPFTEDEYEGFQNTLLGIIQDDLIGNVMMSAGRYLPSFVNLSERSLAKLLVE